MNTSGMKVINYKHKPAKYTGVAMEWSNWNNVNVEERDVS